MAFSQSAFRHSQSASSNEFGGYDGVKIGTWNQAEEKSKLAFYKNNWLWHLSEEMWEDPYVCLQFVQTLFSLWSDIRALLRATQGDEEIAKRVDARFDLVFKFALAMPSITDPDERVYRYMKLNAFSAQITNIAQSVGWGLPTGKKPVEGRDVMNTIKDA